MNVRRTSNTKSSPLAREAQQAEGHAASQRTRNLTHTDPADVSLHNALNALADPVRRTIVRELAAEPDWSRACGTFDLPVSKATRSHHFTVLRQAGIIEQRDAGPRRLNRLRTAEFDAAFPGLLALVIEQTD
ncbi:transcriptional regulator [Streptomyces olivaceiscleroticus]|uniref:Helix-turn-helix domain-containing protein n=1 Tax=Streptomyces olivaceiscleroticus TaxID=68245 RepID=A0ABN1B889_9ACTN